MKRPGSIGEPGAGRESRRTRPGLDAAGWATGLLRGRVVRECKDCKAGGRVGPVLNAPYPGPRCLKHHRIKKREDSERNAAKRRAERYGVSPELWQAILELQELPVCLV